MTNEELVLCIKKGIDVKKNMELLYLQNEKIIASIVWKYHYIFKAPYNCDAIIQKEELMQEGFIGLIKAVERYNPDTDSSFLTYANYWIHQTIKRFIENCGQTVRVPIHTQQKVYKYNQVLRHYGFTYGRDPTVYELSYYLSMTVREVEKLQKYMYRQNVISLDSPLTEDFGDDELILKDTIPDETDVEKKVIDEIVKDQITGEIWSIISKVVNQKMIKVLKYRFEQGLTLQETADKMKISQDAVRNIENKAMRRLRNDPKTKKLMELLY